VFPRDARARRAGWHQAPRRTARILVRAARFARIIASAETTGSLPSRCRDRRTTATARRDLRRRKSLIQREIVSAGESPIEAAAKPRKDRQNLPAVLGIAEHIQISKSWRRERTWGRTFSGRACIDVKPEPGGYGVQRHASQIAAICRWSVPQQPPKTRKLGSCELKARKDADELGCWRR